MPNWGNDRKDWRGLKKKQWKILTNKELEEKLKLNNCSFTEELFIWKIARKCYVGFSVLGVILLSFLRKPNKRCSGLRLSVRFRSPNTFAAELGVRPINRRNIDSDAKDLLNGHSVLVKKSELAIIYSQKWIISQYYFCTITEML
jgi:hypothetical protein